MALDLGKQVGPLPLGAWVVVVGGGLGIALWTRRNAAAATPETVEDTSGVPGVGVGAPAPWTPITSTPTTTTAPTTNEEWGRKVITWGLAMNYPPTLVDSAVRKYLSAVALSVNETAFMAVALVANGPPPQQLPPVEDEDPTTPPTTTVTSATRKSPPEGQSAWSKRGTGWIDRAPHSNVTATYRGGYTNIAAPGSTTEKAHILAMITKNATMGVAYRQGGPWYFPLKVNSDGTWVP
jgi:hypothetical protein